MALSNISIGTLSRTGQGLGTLAEASVETKIEGFGRFTARALHTG